MLDAAAVKITFAPEHTVDPEEDKTIPGVLTVKEITLEEATDEVKHVPPLMLMLQLIVFPLTSVLLV
jgi:hypothetical protein